MPDGRLNNRTAIVTGAAQGMGKTIAEALAREGARVVVSDINEDKVLSLADAIHGWGLRTDVTRKDEVEAMVKGALERYGTVDILVNNAGILRPTRIGDITKEEWDLVLDVNVNGTFLCTKAVLGPMKANGFGRIINMSSSAGRSVSTLGGAHYTTAKAAVLGFTRSVAKELAPYGITANAVCPGLIDTPMVRLECTPERVAEYEQSFPIPRLGTPEDVAKAAAFLLSDDAGYINGTSLMMEGGTLALPPW